MQSGKYCQGTIRKQLLFDREWDSRWHYDIHTFKNHFQYNYTNALNQKQIVSKARLRQGR